MSFEKKCSNGNNCSGSRCPQYEAQLRAGRALCSVFGVVSKETPQPTEVKDGRVQLQFA